jgi:hypothetical protein
MNLILNFTNEGSDTAHFVALIIRGKNAFYFDSFGKQPLKEVIDYSKQHNLKLGYNITTIQHSNTTSCGLYCFALLKFLGKSCNIYKKSNEFLNLFDEKTNLNDGILSLLLNNFGIEDFYE